MEILEKYVWLLMIINNVIGTLSIWVRAQTHIEKNPALRLGYIRLIQGFFLWMSLPWLVMGLGFTVGSISKLSAYLCLRSGNLFILSWWISIWILMIVYYRWIHFQGGAETLVQHPGFSRPHFNDPKTLKFVSSLLIVFGLMIHGIILFIEDYFQCAS
jgi:hypothetical protein